MFCDITVLSENGGIHAIQNVYVTGKNPERLGWTMAAAAQLPEIRRALTREPSCRKQAVLQSASLASSQTGFWVGATDPWPVTKAQILIGPTQSLGGITRSF